MFSGDASQILALGNDLGLVGRKAVPAMRTVIAEAGLAFEEQWRSNAVETSGQHGKHYPASIESELRPGFSTISVEVGPNPGMPQGGMSFEYGSSKQPPHLDGLRALDVIGPRVERGLDSALGFLFP